MQVWNMLHAARWKYRMQKIAKIHHLGTIAQLCRAVSLQLRHLSTVGKKNFVKQQCLLHMSSQYMANFGPLTAENEIGSGVWGTPANFNGFLVLPSLLQRRRSPQTNQRVHDLWPSPGLVHYRPTFGLLWFDICERILIFFGINVTNKASSQKTLYYATSDNLCFCTIW